MSSFQVVEPLREGARAMNAAAIESLFPELRTHKRPDSFNLARMLNDMALEQFGASTSYEASLCAATAMAQGGHHDPQRAMLPWSALAGMQRDLIVGSPNAGGNLVGQKVVQAVDVLRPNSLLVRQGIRVIENNMQNLAVPRISSPVTGQWLATDTSPISTSDPVIGVVSSKPKTAGALVKLSRQLLLQGENANAIIAEQLLQCMGDMLDKAVLGGTGLMGQPTGIVNTAGVLNNALSAAITPLNIESSITYLEGNGVPEENIKVVTVPTVKNYLKYLDSQAWNNLGSAWKDGKLLEVPAFSTSRAPASKIIFGDFSKVQVALWGRGIEIHVDPYTSFTTGAVQVRVLMHCDVQVLQPQAFHVITLP